MGGILLTRVCFLLSFLFLCVAQASVCPPVSRVHFGVNIGLQYAHRSARVNLKGCQSYQAGYDVSEHYADPVFNGGVGSLGGVNYAGVVNVLTPGAAKEGFLLRHIVPARVVTTANAAVDLPANALNVWAYGTEGLGVRHFAKHERAVESSGGICTERGALGLRVDLESFIEVHSVRVGAWAAYVYYFDFKDGDKRLASYVQYREPMLTGSFFLPYPMESKAYEPAGFKMIFSEKTTVRWQDYGRYGVFLGYRMNAALSFDLRLGLRYVFGTLRMHNTKMVFPYAHRTYNEQVAPKDSGVIDLGNVELTGGGWAPVFGLYARVCMGARGGVLFGAEFSNADIDLSWKPSHGRESGEAKRSVDNPIKGVVSTHLVAPNGWHMTYVDRLDLALQAQVHTTEISVCAMYNVRF